LNDLIFNYFTLAKIYRGSTSVDTEVEPWRNYFKKIFNSQFSIYNQFSITKFSIIQ